MSPLAPIPSLNLEAAGMLVGALQAEEQGQGFDADRQRLPQIRGYRPRRRLGSGGGGVVYEAYAEGTGQRLAIKVLNASASGFPEGEESGAVGFGLGGGGGGDVGDGGTGGSAGAGSSGLRVNNGGTRRAWRELDLLSQLRLAAIPRVLDYGVHEGRLFIVTEHVDGVALDAYCGVGAGGAAGAGRSSMTLEERVACLATVADAVQTLHEHGIIHRDIKPSNILIDERGRPVIIDLGIASLLARDVMETLTVDGAPMGTPAFMAPEQARGDRDSVSTRADIYALGATACLILTGQTPHDLAAERTPTLAAAVHRVAHEAPRDPLELEPTLPRALGAVLAKALDPRPERRYASAGALAEDLRRWLRGEAVLAAAPTAWMRAARWLGRHPVGATAGVCGLIVALTAVTTTLLVRLVYMQPYEVVIDPATRSRVDLVTMGGRSLATWTGGAPSTVHFADLIERVGEGEGGEDGPLVLIGWSGAALREERGLLAAYEPGRPGSPVWVRGVGDVDIAQPEPSPDGYANTFVVRTALVCDVFKELPGREVIAVHIHHPYSPSAIRVYNAAGDVLYETWHDGAISQIAWLEAERVVVAYGVNCDLKWNELGYPGLVKHHWPHIFFAVRPVRGERTGFIATPDGIGDARALWYKFLVPARASNAIDPGLALIYPPATGQDYRTHFRWNFRAEAEVDAGGTLVIRDDGEIVDRYMNDSYKDAGLTPIEEFGLVDAVERGAGGGGGAPVP